MLNKPTHAHGNEEFHKIDIPLLSFNLAPHQHPLWKKVPPQYFIMSFAAPGTPPYFLHNTSTSIPKDDTGVERILVIVLGAACGVLLLVCLVLVALVRHLQRGLSSQHQSQTRTQIIPTNQNSSYFWMISYYSQFALHYMDLTKGVEDLVYDVHESFMNNLFTVRENKEVCEL